MNHPTLSHLPMGALLTAIAVAALCQPDSMRAQEAGRSSPEMEALSRMRWREIGPTNQAGRVSVFVGVPGDPNVLYVSGANGGIFKSSNGGITWKPIFENQAVLSIGAIEVAPSNPNVLYVGTGEGNPRNNASFGDGVYRSNDAGETWTHVGLEDSDRIARIRIDSRNPDIVYACAMGREWGPNEQRGVFRRPTAARTGRRCSTRTPAPAAPTSTSTRRTPTRSTPACIPSSVKRGTCGAAAARRRSTSPWTAAPRGRR